MKLMVCSVFLACVSLSFAASLHGAEAVLRRRTRSYGANTDPYGNSIDGGPIDAMNAMNVVDPLAPVDAVKEDSSEEKLPVDPPTPDPGTVEEQAAEIQEQISGLITDPPAKESPAEQAAEAQEQAPQKEQQAEKPAVPDPDPPQPGPDNSNKEDGDHNGKGGVDAGTAADAAAQRQEQAAEAQPPQPDPPQPTERPPAPNPPAQPDHGNGHQDGHQRNEDTKSRK